MVSRLTIVALVVVQLVFFATPTRAINWAEAITAVRHNAEELAKEADELGASPLGSAFNEIDADTHQCAILGRLLRKSEVIGHLELPLPAETATPDEFRLAANSLENWIVAAEDMLALSRERRVEIWNLDCVGHLEIPLGEYIPTARGTRTFFDMSEDGETLRILGDVEEGFAASIRKALSENPTVKTVALGSAGGRVAEALEAGLEIRKRRLETTLWANCYSACPLVFLGGLNRTIWSPYPELGFHQASVKGVAVPHDDPLYLLVFRYAEAMGADAGAVVSFMLSAAPYDMNVPNVLDLCEAAITLWVQRACAAEDAP